MNKQETPIDDEDQELLKDLDEKEGKDKVKDKSKASANAPLQLKGKTEAERKREQRKHEREQRKKKIEKLQKKKAQHSGEDPEELKKIEEAKRTFGKYDLKMALDYEVPEHMQVDANKKKQQMTLLEGSIHKLKVDFNTKVIDMQQRKQQIISRLSTLHGKLNTINEKLGTPETLVLPTVDDAVEYPNKKYEISDGDIEEYKEAKRK